MKTFVLKGADVMGREDLYRKLAEGLDFPEWYGGNLDALYDCLTDLEETTIRITDRRELEITLGDYVNKVFRVLRDAAAENDRLRIEF